MADFSREGFVRRISNARPFFGFAPLFAWHFCFWFAPNSMPCSDLLSNAVTFSWLVYLAASCITLIATAAILRNRHKLSSVKGLVLGTPLALTVLSAAFSSNILASWEALHFLLLPILMGLTESLCLLIWGEHYARHAITGSTVTVMTVTASSTLALLIVLRILPGAIAAALIAFLPIISGIMMAKPPAETVCTQEEDTDPVLKPSEMRHRAMRNVLMVGGISCVVSTACFHLMTIVPKESLAGGQWGYCYGMMVGAAFLLILVACLNISHRDDNPYRLLPWLMVTVIVALSVHLGLGHAADSFSFFFTSAVYSSFELLLMVYFVIVAHKGGISSAIAVGISVGLFRLGVVCGNGLALMLESQNASDSLYAAAVATALLCAVAMLVIPFIAEGRYIEKLTAKPLDVGEEALMAACEATAREFGLSPRESEVLEYLARGYPAAKIAEKMVISEYTVRAHTRHIYEKTDLHKRGDLIGYIKDQMPHYGG